MAAVESYSPCPCGSGQKFKWCCQKVESFVTKAQRLFDTGQLDSAIKTLDEGLRKEPGNPWLSTRKAVMQIRDGQAEGAMATLRAALARNPDHFGSLVLLTRCVLETEGAVNGAGMFQQVLSAVAEHQRPGVASLARVVAYLLNEARLYPAALKHLELSRSLGDPDGSTLSAIRNIEVNPAVAPWLKDTYLLAPVPNHWTGDGRDRFEAALVHAAKGCWAAAAAIFDSVSGGEPGGEADYNLGLCRLWLGDEAGAVVPLRRRVAKLGKSTAAVDLEALCQQIAPILPDDRIEQVRLTWPLRNRQALHEALGKAPDVVFDGSMPIDPNQPDSPTIDQFVLLDRPQLSAESIGTLKPQQIPRILGRVGLSDDAAMLETYDDGRVDALGDRFTVLAGAAIVAAHPRTSIIAVAARSTLALTWEWLYPPEVDQAEAVRLEQDQRALVLQEVWPVTPMPYLDFQTPERAAHNPNAEISLRAALCQFEYDLPIDSTGQPLSLRNRLQVAAEPTADPQTVDIAQLPLARLESVPVAELDDDRLVLLYRRSRRAMLHRVMDTTARAIVARSHLFGEGKIDPVAVYSDLASNAASDGDTAGVLDWLNAGRRADTPANRGRNAPIWDMVEIRLRARLEAPEVWVPELAILLERYGREPVSNQVILVNLVEMGLVRMAPNPDNPSDFLLDSRPLQAVLAEYGPRVTTASGGLGVSATKPDIWTPGSPATGGGGLWTPGAASSAAGASPQAGGGPSKLILPGR